MKVGEYESRKLERVEVDACELKINEGFEVGTYELKRNERVKVN